MRNSDICQEEQLPLAERLHRGSDRICNLILYSDMPWIDIEIETDKLRQQVLIEDPDHADLFEALYASRFERLRDQWRSEADPNWVV